MSRENNAGGEPAGDVCRVVEERGDDGRVGVDVWRVRIDRWARKDAVGHSVCQPRRFFFVLLFVLLFVISCSAGRFFFLLPPLTFFGAGSLTPWATPSWRCRAPIIRPSDSADSRINERFAVPGAALFRLAIPSSSSREAGFSRRRVASLRSRFFKGR